MYYNNKFVYVTAIPSVYFLCTEMDTSPELESFSKYVSCYDKIMTISKTAMYINSKMNIEEIIEVIYSEMEEIFDEINNSSVTDYTVWLDDINIIHIRDSICINPDDVCGPTEEMIDAFIDSLEGEIADEYFGNYDVINPQICIFKKEFQHLYMNAKNNLNYILYKYNLRRLLYENIFITFNE